LTEQVVGRRLIDATHKSKVKMSL